MRVAFRVDASREIGTGHIYRCLALAAALGARGARSLFLTRPLGVASVELIRSSDAEVIELAPRKAGPVQDDRIPHAAWAGASVEDDAAETLGLLQGRAVDWMVVDGYVFDDRWHRAVRAGLGCRIAAIDDVADRSFDPDLLIDHNHAPDHRAKYAVRLPEDTRLLGGPLYALLRPAFAVGHRHSIREEVRSVGIFMGGIDRPNHSVTALRALDQAGFTGGVEIVATSANPNRPELMEAIAARPNTRLTLDLPDLAAFFARHDLQIGAGGGSSWERCCIGAPTLLLITALNQMAVAPDLAAQGVVATPEPIDALDVETIACALRGLIADPELRRALAEKSRALVDGRGAGRVAEEMLK